MSKRAVVTASLIVSLSVVAGVWWALAADASQAGRILVTNTGGVGLQSVPRVLLVFINDASGDRSRVTDAAVEGADQYRVVNSAARAPNVERHLNRMAREGFRYHSVIRLDAPLVAPDRQVARVVTGTSAFDWSSTRSMSHHGLTRETEWVKRSGSGSQYRVIEAGTWRECETAARAQGGHLVMINDADEQAWLTETYGDMGNVWIGLTDARSEGAWRWIDGDPPDFTNWASRTNEPSNQWAGGEDFAHMNWVSPGEWNDLGPASPEWTSVTHGIIERPARMHTPGGGSDPGE